MRSVGSISSRTADCSKIRTIEVKLRSGMRRLKVAYAMLLAVIYVTATAMSSLAVFACDHDHLHFSGHTASCDGHVECCHCHHTTEAEATFDCGHRHSLLGENFTEYITSGVRANLRSDDGGVIVTDYATVPTSDIDLSPATISITACTAGYESAPPRAAITSHESLRAPPYWV